MSIRIMLKYTLSGAVAQLVRALGCQPRGRGSESLQPRKISHN